MASDLNDHNMLRPDSEQGSSPQSTRKILIWIVVGISVLFLLYLRITSHGVPAVTESPQQANSGNEETTPFVGEDPEPPSVVSHLGKKDYMVGSFPPDNRPLIWAEYGDGGSGIDVKSVRMLMDSEEKEKDDYKDITSLCTVTSEKISFKPAKTLPAPKQYKFKVIVSDKAGNTSEIVWEILLKRC